MKKFIIFIIIASVLGLLNLSYAFEVENLINKNEQTGHMMVIICIALSLITLGFLIFTYLGKGTGTVNKKIKFIICLVTSLIPLLAFTRHFIIYLVYFVQGPIG